MVITFGWVKKNVVLINFCIFQVEKFINQEVNPVLKKYEGKLVDSAELNL